MPTFMPDIVIRTRGAQRRAIQDPYRGDGGAQKISREIDK